MQIEYWTKTHINLTQMTPKHIAIQPYTAPRIKLAEFCTELGFAGSDPMQNAMRIGSASLMGEEYRTIESSSPRNEQFSNAGWDADGWTDDTDL